MSFGNTIIDFFNRLSPPSNLPEGVDILWPYDDPEVKRVMTRYYTSYFDDSDRRIFLLGINPGRFGAGVTGICFTDPVRLSEDCGIIHGLKGGRELSSDFVYRMIQSFGGPADFFRHFYLGSLSPVGFLRGGKNLNYYDVKGLPKSLDAWMAQSMEVQMAAGADRRIAFSLGQGANYRYLLEFNARHGFFDRIEPLPHPRWVMQYRRKRLNEFIRLYIDMLQANLDV